MLGGGGTHGAFHQTPAWARGRRVSRSRPAKPRQGGCPGKEAVSFSPCTLPAVVLAGTMSRCCCLQGGAALCAWWGPCPLLECV